MVKMKDVATATGLALSTVSEILRGKGGYNTATVELVHATAKRLDYRPNPISLALNGQKTRTIGLFVTSWVTSYSVNRRVEGLLESAAEENYLIYTAYARFSNPDYINEYTSVVKDLISRRVDGFVFYGTIPKETKTVLNQSGLPYVMFGDVNEGITGAQIDRTAGIKQAACHLAELGHREAGLFVTASYDGKPSKKVEIYKKYLKMYGIRPIIQPEWEIPFVEDLDALIYERVRALAKCGKFPTAFLMNNDEFTYPALAAFRDAGVRVPQDVSIIGFDNHPGSSYCFPPLTTIAVPHKEVGKSAFQLLKGMIDAPPATRTSKIIKIKTNLVIRQSTDTPRQ